MQSECLCALGLCFCHLPSHNFSDPFKVVSMLIKESKSVLRVLQGLYKNYFYPSLPSMETITVDSRKSEHYGVIHYLCKSLNGLLIDVRQLEEYIQANDNGSTQHMSSHVFSNLSAVEKELIMLLDSVKLYNNRSLKRSSENVDLRNNMSSLKTENDPDQIIHKVSVGFSDFSVRGVDEVFIGCSSSNNYNSSEVSNDTCTEYQPPPSLLNELKTALIIKRKEFGERELKALKNHDDIEAFKACIDSDLTLLPSTTDVSKCKNTDTNFKNYYMNHPNDKIDGSVLNDISFRKDIALAACNLSSKWNNMENIDLFEDNSSSE